MKILLGVISGGKIMGRVTHDDCTNWDAFQSEKEHSIITLH